jgi:hypothetical protein
MRSPVFALDNSFGGAFGHGQRIGRRNAQVVGYLDHDYHGGRRPHDGSRYERNLSLRVGGRTNDREDRRIGGATADGIDVEFAINPSRDPQSTGNGETGIFSVIPTNIFAALSSKDSVRVLIFAVIFGIGMVMTERQSGHSIFGALRHVQAVCITIFDWFSLLVPVGIVALIAPQVALLGPDAFTVLALFGCAFLATSFLLLSCATLVCALLLRGSPGAVFAALLKPDAWRIDAQHADLHSHCVRSVEGRSKDKTRDM